MLDGLKAAGKQLDLSRDQLVFEVGAYARRNRLCHTSIQGVIDRCQFAALAERILDDKALRGKLSSPDRSTDPNPPTNLNGPADPSQSSSKRPSEGGTQG